MSSKRSVDMCFAAVRNTASIARDAVVLVRAGNVVALRIARREEGFPVDSGSAAERVMRAAVRCGYAEELPEDARWRSELSARRNQRVQRDNEVREV